MFWRHQSYEVLPALSVRRRELRATLRTITLAYIFGVAWGTCIGGGQLKVFARMVGFDDFDFGLMAALPFMATFGQLVASVLIERTGLRKYQFIYWGVTHRVFWFGIAAIPLILAVPSDAAVHLTLTLLALSWLTNALSLPAILSWFGDLIPRRIRGRYLAYRERWGVAVQVVVIIAISLVMDRLSVPGARETPQAQPALLAGICIIFAVAAVLGTTDILLFRRIRDVKPPIGWKTKPPAFQARVPRPRQGGLLAHLGYAARQAADLLRQILVDPLRDRPFRLYVTYGVFLTFSMTVGGWFFWRHAMDGLGFSKLGANSLFLVVSPLAGILTARGWGALIDRWGRRPVLLLSTFVCAFTVVPWLCTSSGMSSPAWMIDAVNAVSAGAGTLLGRGDWAWADARTPVAAYLLAMLGCIIAGASWMGVSLAQTGVVLGFSDTQGRSKYVAACSVLTSLGGILGGLVGGKIAQAMASLQSHPLELGPFHWNNWQITFLLTGAARLLSLIWLAAMDDPGSRPVGPLLRYWGASVYNNLTSWPLFTLRVLGLGRKRGKPPRDDRE